MILVHRVEVEVWEILVGEILIVGKGVRVEVILVGAILVVEVAAILVGLVYKVEVGVGVRWLLVVLV